MDKNIIVLFGGQSSESLVSVASAQYIAKAISDSKLWYWHKSGLIYEISNEFLFNHQNPFTCELIPKTKPIFNNIKNALENADYFDYIFVLALHGGAGEDGSLQKMLEDANRAFTGSDSKSSHIAFNKVLTKKALPTSINLAPHEILHFDKEGNYQQKIKQFFKVHGQSILKPVSDGSSVGVVKLTKESDFLKAFTEVSSNSEREYMLEKMIFGRELTVGVVENEDGLSALPVIEIVVGQGQDFDYHGKYLNKDTKEICPADISQKHTGLAQRIAIAAHESLGLYGYSRTDLILSNDDIYFLEINTLPGMTASSLFPKSLSAFGQSMRDFLRWQIALAKKRKTRC